MTSPMPAQPFVPGAVLRSPVALGRAAAVLLGLVIAADVFSCYAVVLELSVTGDMADGATGADVAHRADHADALYGASALVYGVVLLATAVVYLCWLWRVRVNAEVFDQSAHSMRRGWTIGAWFCPIVNLWFPRRVVADAWDASTPLGMRSGHRPVDAWWSLWLLSLFAGRFANTSYNHADTPAELRDASRLMLCSDALDIAAAALAIVVVVVLTRMQDRKALAGPLPTPVFG